LKQLQKDKMIRGKGGPIWATALARRREINDMGLLNPSWKEEKSSDWFQAAPNGTGYVDPLEECK
jgi:hypothetical protein